MLTFCAHGKSVQNKMQARTNILRSLDGSSYEWKQLCMNPLHAVDVRSAINNYSTNPITANRPPPIDGSDQELPRRTSATLAQLRSGWNIPSWCTSSVQCPQETDNTRNNITMDQPQRSSDIPWPRHWRKLWRNMKRYNNNNNWKFWIIDLTKFVNNNS